MVTNFSFARDVIDQLDGWVDQLVAPLLPPRMVLEGPDLLRLELRKHLPHTVMIGKCVLAVSGIRAALDLADRGSVVECAIQLRTVSDMCTEIIAIGVSLNRGGELPPAVQTFVAQYFMTKPRTLDQFEAARRVHYVSREDLLKVRVSLAEDAHLDGEQIRTNRRFINMAYDTYVHGAYETTMELYDPQTGRFMMRGHPSPSKRQEFVEAVALKLHEVVVALEITAAVTAQADVFQAARETRRAMDAADP